MPGSLIDLNARMCASLDTRVNEALMHFLVTGEFAASASPAVTQDIIVKGSLPLTALTASLATQLCLGAENPFQKWQYIERWRNGEYESSSAVHGPEFMYLYTIFDIMKRIDLPDLRRLLIENAKPDQRDETVTYEEASQKVTSLVLKIAVLERHYQIQDKSQLDVPSIDDIVQLARTYLQVQAISNKLFHQEVGWTALNLLGSGSYIERENPILRLISVSPILKFSQHCMKVGTTVPEMRSAALQVFLLNSIPAKWFPEFCAAHLQTTIEHFTSIFAPTSSVASSFFAAYMFFGKGEYEPTEQLSAFLPIFHILSTNPAGRKMISEISRHPIPEGVHSNIDVLVTTKILKRVTGNEIPITRISKKVTGEDHNLDSKEEITDLVSRMLSSKSPLGYVIVHNESLGHWGLFIILNNNGEFKMGFFDSIGKDATAYIGLARSVFSSTVECLHELGQDKVKEDLVVVCEHNIQKGSLCGWAVIWAGETIKQQVARGDLTLTIKEPILNYPEFIHRVSRFYDITCLPGSLFEADEPTDHAAPASSGETLPIIHSPQITEAVKEIVFTRTRKGYYRAQCPIPKKSFVYFGVPQSTEVIYILKGKIFFLTHTGDTLPSIHIIPTEKEVQLSSMELLKLTDVAGKTCKSTVLDSECHVLFQCQEQDASVRYLPTEGGFTAFTIGTADTPPAIYIAPEQLLDQLSISE